MSIPIWALIAGLVVSALGIGASAYGQHRANETNVQLNRENNELQQQLAGQANQWNIEQWNRANEYDSPSSQVARLAGANLNPALIYGNGNLVNSAAASPAATMANTEAANIQNPFENLSSPFLPDNLLKMAEVERLQTQNLKDLELLPYQKDSIAAATDVSKSLVEVNEQSILESVSRVSLNEETTKKLTEETKNFALNNQYLADTLADREKMVLNQRTISDIDVEYFEQRTKQAINESKALVSNYLASAKASLAKANLDNTERQYIQKQVDNYQKTLNNLDAQTRQLESMSDLQRAEEYIVKHYGSGKAEQEIKKMKSERITSYVNAFSGAIRDVGVGVGAFIKGTRKQ